MVVLSNNDGCVVARSNESKAMGIRMGTPFYQVKHLVEAGRLEVRSSNYILYGDMSDRVMSILADAVPKIEIYSIDEAFLVMDGLDGERIAGICRELVSKVRKWVDDDEKRMKALSLTPIGDVWGVGRRNVVKMQEAGVLTAADFVERPEVWVDRHFAIPGVRTWKELQGIVCHEEELPDKRKSICTSRSFADMLADSGEIEVKVADFAAHCARKLREEETAATQVTVFLMTNRFRTDLAQYNPSATVTLDVAASSSPEIISAALKAFRMIYRPGYQYKKAGVIVDGIVDKDAVQGVIFGFDNTARERQDVLSSVMDAVNDSLGLMERSPVRPSGRRRRHSSGTDVIGVASQHLGHFADGIRSEHRSRRYTTDFSEILDIH